MRYGKRIVAVAVVTLLVTPLAGRSPVRARNAMVVTEEALATDVGVEVLRSGGNVVDAAVAVGFALAVTHPEAGNLGGGGFLLVRFADGESVFLDFRERAPEKAHRNMYLDENGVLTNSSIVGWRASGVPGTVMGLERAHRKYGQMKWSELLAPAIRLAAEGLTVSWELAESLRSSNRLPRFSESRRIFLNEGRYYEPGDKLVQPELAATLTRIAKTGASDFYRGETALRIVAEMQAHGGLVTRADLANYEVLEREPLRGAYKGYEILTAPPPSSGGIGILQMLGMLDVPAYRDAEAGSAASIHYLAEVMRRFFADRSEYLADPEYHDVPVGKLLSREYIRERQGTIDSQRATSSQTIGPGRLSGQESAATTHYSIADGRGNAVAVTYTLNGGFGSGVTVPGLGFLLNNEMDDFSAKPGEPNMFGLVQGEANRIEPGKRPLSSMTPTIVLRDGRPYVVLGARGGSRIISAVLQVLRNTLDLDMNIQDAVDRPRFHHQWKPDRLSLENGFSPDTISLLRERGHEVVPIRTVAVVEAVLFDGKWLQGAVDGRGSGKAAGF